jgi:septal ring factor EnvC (AmiA/AmiB activator)
LGVLRNALKELRALFYDLLAAEGKLGSGNWNREELEAQVHRSKEACEQLQRQLSQAQDNLKHKADEVDDLSGKVIVMLTSQFHHRFRFLFSAFSSVNHRVIEWQVQASGLLVLDRKWRMSC